MIAHAQSHTCANQIVCVIGPHAKRFSWILYGDLKFCVFLILKSYLYNLNLSMLTTIITYFQFSSAVFSLMVENCLCVRCLKYNCFLVWMNLFDKVYPYNSFLYFSICSEHAHVKVFLAVLSYAQNYSLALLAARAVFCSSQGLCAVLKLRYPLTFG